MTDIEHIPTNDKVTKEFLENLREEILVNKAEPKDYEFLENQLSNYFGISDYIKNQMKKYSIFSFEQYIEERKRPIIANKLHLESTLIGVLNGVIKVLIDKINYTK